MSAHDEQLAVFFAMFAADTVARSGFPGDLRIATSYSLGGPLIGTLGYSNAVQHIPPPYGISETIELLYGLGGGWAAAILDDGHVCLTNNQANAYIRPGVYLPSDVSLIRVVDNDSLLWQLYGWPAPDRLVAAAQHDKWIDRVRTIVAPNDFHRALHRPFDWVRPTIGGQTIELIEFDTRLPDHSGKPLCGRTGRHRLEVVDPARYAELSEQVSAGGQLSVLPALAERTVAGAAVALAALDDSAENLLSEVIPEETITCRRLLQIVAETDPADIVWRRNVLVNALRWPPCNELAVGCPADSNPGWAHCVDRAYDWAVSHARGLSLVHYQAARGLLPMQVSAEDLRIRLDEYARAMLVSAALEAILLWSADPLPVADIEYASRSVCPA